MENLNPESLPDSSNSNEGAISTAEVSKDISYEDLLDAYIEGDEASFEKLFDAVGGRIFGFILRYIGNYTQAEDVYQDVCVKIAVKANTYSRKASFMSWAFQITRNTCIDVIRSKGRKPKVSIDGGGTEFDSPIEIEDTSSSDPSDGMVRLELAKAIAKAVDKLPDEQREVFLLKEEGGLTFEEISDIVNCGKETAKSRMRYALERLRNSLGQEAKNYGLH